MKVEIKVPEVGESITEGVLIEWFKGEGERVEADDPLFDLETDKITMTVPAERGGKLSVAVEAGSTVEVGQVVGSIDTEAAAAAAGEGMPASATGDEAPASADDDDPPLSPATRRAVAEHGVDPRSVDGSGRGGRLTKDDVLRAARAQQGAAAEPRTAPAEQRARPASPPPGERRETREPMSSLRRRVAERLLQVQQNAAILTTFNEVEMTELLAMRARHKQAFSERHGVRLGFMSFFVKAAVEALKSVPALNARIDGDEIVQQHYYDIGVAVGTKRGLVVPVLRDADRASFAEIERQIGDFAERARSGRLELSELTGGCFTISNGGVYGSLASTPILNPPQSGILGMHAVKKRAVVVEDDRIEARPVMFLAMSYDHRVVDGTEAVTFLRRIVDCIEHPERLLLEV